jgi:hypothetical protein
MGMTTAQTWLIVGGVFNLFFSTLAAYALYWVRLRDPQKPVPHYGLIAHTSSVTNGMLLLGLSIAIEHTNFAPGINTGLAVAAVVATELSNVRNIILWAQGHQDSFAEVSDVQRRLRGLTNIINLVVMSSIFYGVARTALGL